jgi:hypothetical protein
MQLYFTFFLIFLKGLLWLCTRIFIKISNLQQDNIQVLFKSNSNNQHFKQAKQVNLSVGRWVITQLEIQNHICTNDTNFDCKMSYDKMFCHPPKTLIMANYIKSF